MIQTNLFDEGIAEIYMIVKKMNNHKAKLYKKCGIINCKEEILNKPHKHYCWIHLMDNVLSTTPLFPIQSQTITIHS